MNRIMQWIFTILGGLLGLAIGNVISEHPSLLRYIPIHNELILYAVCIIIFAIIIYFIFPFVVSALKKVALGFEKGLRGVNNIILIMQIISLIVSLILAALISSAFNNFPVSGIQWVISIPIYLVLGYLGWTLPRYRSADILHFISRFRRTREVSILPENQEKEDEKEDNSLKLKLLDTSVIIDGRIADIYKTRFIESSLVIPVYVLNELQLISDSSDDLKRSKGRRGLDIIAQLQNDFGDKIQILEEDYSDLKEVDAKLIKTAKEKNYKIITNDYNLNKLASVQGIEILNINELANAVKTVVHPGEEITVSLIKAGKEAGQAIAYLDDGTMIVVEHGKHLIGQTIDAIVTSILQTSAGRMIFARPKGDE